MHSLHLEQTNNTCPELALLGFFPLLQRVEKGEGHAAAKDTGPLKKRGWIYPPMTGGGRTQTSCFFAGAFKRRVFFAGRYSETE